MQLPFRLTKAAGLFTALFGVLFSALGSANSPLNAQSSTAIPNMTGKIITVNGPADPSVLGHTLMHEHIFIDFTLPDEEPERWTIAGRKRPIGATQVALYKAPLTIENISSVMLGSPNRDNLLLNDEKTAIAEVFEYKRRGGGSIVDVTSIGLKRNPAGLQRISQSTGVPVIMGSSWYTEAWYPANLAERSIESLTDEIVRDITVGVNGTPVRAGIIGEVGTGGNPDKGLESKIIRASARASRMTGAAITLHSVGSFKQHSTLLKMLTEEGADPSRVIFGHSDLLAGQLDYLKSILDRGATIQFDLLGRPPLVTRTRPLDSEVARTIADLAKAGYADRILISHDICTKTSWKAYGGTGYSFIEETFLPYLKRLGVTPEQLNQIIVENPRRLLTFVAPR